MNAARAIRVDVAVYLLGTGFYALSQWLLVVLYARAGGPGSVGMFAVATAIGAPIVVLSQLSLRQVLIADVGGRFAFRDFLAARWTLTGVAVVAIVLAAAAFGYRGPALLTIAAFGVGRAFESVSDIYYARAQAHGGLRRVSLYTGVRGVATLAAAGGVMAATGDMLTSAAAFAIASLACQLLVRRVEGRAVREDGGAAARLLSRALLLHSAPLALSQFLLALTAYAPRLVLQHFGGEPLAGQAGAVEYILSLGLLGVAALGQAASAPMARTYHAGDRTGFVRLAGGIAAGAAILGIGVTAAASVVGSAAILTLYGPSFAEAASAVTIIVAGGAFGYVASVLGYAIGATGRYQQMIGWSALVLAATVAGGYAAVGRFGLFGLGLALGVSGILTILAYLHLLRRACVAMPAAAVREDAAHG